MADHSHVHRSHRPLHVLPTPPPTPLLTVLLTVLVATVVAGLLAACGGSGSGTTAELAGTGASTVPAGRTSVAPPTTLDPGPPVAADTPEGLATQLGEAEAAIRDPASSPALLARMGHTQQLAYGRLGGRPEWHETVLSAVPGALRPVVESNLLAITELRRQYQADAAAYPQAPGYVPDWTILAPEPYDRLLAEYRQAEAATGVPWQYLAAIHFVETRVGRIRGNSVAGAQGPMQFIPSTWRIYGNGGDVNDTHDAIQAAARMLKTNGAPDRMDRALFSYNPSNRYVRAVTAYAELIRADENAFRGYYHWQVYYGSELLPVGWGA